MSEDVKPQIWIIFKSNDQEAKLIELEPTMQIMDEMADALEQIKGGHTMYKPVGQGFKIEKKEYPETTIAREVLEKYRKFKEGLK